MSLSISLRPLHRILLFVEIARNSLTWRTAKVRRCEVAPVTEITPSVGVVFAAHHSSCRDTDLRLPTAASRPAGRVILCLAGKP
jgi:hypothetical protein